MTLEAHQQRLDVVAAQRASDLRAVLDTPEGRRLVWRLLEDANLFGGSYTGEAISTAYAEGQRATAIRLMAEAQRVAPSAYLAMVTEAAATVREEMLRQKLEAAKADDVVDEYAAMLGAPPR